MSRSVQLLWLATLLTVLFVATSSRSQAEPGATGFRECATASVLWHPERLPLFTVAKKSKGTTAVPEGWSVVGGAANTMLICH